MKKPDEELVIMEQELEIATALRSGTYDEYERNLDHWWAADIFTRNISHLIIQLDPWYKRAFEDIKDSYDNMMNYIAEKLFL